MALLADPVFLTTIAIFAAACAYFVSKRASLLIGVVALVFLYLVSTPIVSHKLLSSLESELETHTYLAADEPEAIVILGADVRHRSKEFGGDTVGRLSLERIRYGARLYRETGLPILTTGADIGGSDKSVALVMAEALRDDYQVPVHWIEERSRNTFENAERSAEILQSESVTAVFLVTHGWHMPRALEAFQKVGMGVIPRPTALSGPNSTIGISDFVPHSGALRNSAFALHEWVGRVWYRARYY